MYYNFTTETLYSEAQLMGTGINIFNDDLLERLTIVKVKTDAPEVDKALYLVTDDGITVDSETIAINYVVTTRHIAVVRDVLKERLKQKRIAIEQGGITITDTGTILDSTRVDGQMIHNSYIGLSTLLPDAIIDFYTASGWVTITVQALESIFLIYSNHVDSCFKREKEISDLLDAAETSEQAIELFNTEINNGWPTYV